MRLKKAELAYPATFKRPEGKLGVDWHVFDDHIRVNDNVIEKNNVFFLDILPVGEVRILLLSE